MKNFFTITETAFAAMLLASAVAVHAADEATERRLGIRAVANGDYSNAVNFFKSALALSGEDQEKWAANAVDLAAAKLRTGDLAGARELLAEAGYPDGFSMTITVPSNYQPHIDTATVLVEQLKAVGITAEIQPVEWGAWLSEVYGNRQFQSTVVGVDASNMTARALLERFTSAADDNFINYQNTDYDALFQQAQATADDAEQTELYKQMERNLTEHAANVYIQDLADLVVLRNGLEGYQFYPIYVMDLSTVHYAQ